MHLTLDIEEKANEIQKGLVQGITLGGLFISFNLFGLRTWWLKRINRQISTRYVKRLDEFILSLEGFQGHISDLKIEAAADLLSDVRNTIREFDKMDEEFTEIAYPENPFFKERFRYLLKTLYKTEALLHVATTKHLPIIPTPDYIKAGLTRMSQETILKALH